MARDAKGTEKKKKKKRTDREREGEKQREIETEIKREGERNIGMEKLAMNKYLLIITLNVNGLNVPIKRHRVVE